MNQDLVSNAVLSIWHITVGVAGALGSGYYLQQEGGLWPWVPMALSVALVVTWLVYAQASWSGSI